MAGFRVMSFNIRGANHDDGVNSWPRRAALNIEVIQRAAPDIIGFQEYETGNQREYDRYLTDYAYEAGPALARESDSGGYHCAIYWRARRFERMNGGAFFLNSKPAEYGLDWGMGHGRGLHWMTLRDRRDGAAFVFANTHLPHDSEIGRIRGARLILHKLGEISQDRLPVVLAADFNSRATIYREAWRELLTEEQKRLADENWSLFAYRNNVYEIFKAGGYSDAFIAAGNADAPSVSTAHGFMSNAPPLNLRIDWILTRGNSRRIRCRCCAIIEDAQPPVYPSDHYPVIADIEML